MLVELNKDDLENIAYSIGWCISETMGIVSEESINQLEELKERIKDNIANYREE